MLVQQVDALLVRPSVEIRGTAASDWRGGSVEWGFCFGGRGRVVMCTPVA